MLTVLGISVIGTISYVGLEGVRNRLHSLTEVSTPFQLKTVEFTRALQEHIVRLFELSGVQSSEGLLTSQDAIARSLKDVRGVASQLADLRGGNDHVFSSMLAEVEKITRESIFIAKERIEAERRAAVAVSEAKAKLDANSRTLNRLDLSMREMHAKSINNLANAGSKARATTSKLGETQKMKDTAQDMQLALAELHGAHSSQMVTTAKDRIKYSVYVITSQSGKDFPSISSMAGDLGKTVLDRRGLVETKLQLLSKPGDPKLEQAYKALYQQCKDRTAKIMMELGEELDSSNISFMSGNAAFDASLSESRTASRIVTLNAELTAAGISIESLVAKLFLTKTAADLDSIKKLFADKISHAQQTTAEIGATLQASGRKSETGMIKDVSRSLGEVKALLIGGDGLVDILGLTLRARERSNAINAALNKMVDEHRGANGKNITTAQEEQAKAVSTANLMVKTAITLVIIVGAALLAMSILFGKLIEKSITEQVNTLVFLAERFRNGDFTARVDHPKKDEFGKVAAHFNETAMKISAMSQHIITISEDLSTRAGHLDETAARLNNDSHNQTVNTEQSVVSIVQISQANQEVARNIHDTALNADRMLALAGEGKVSMEVTAGALKKFADKVLLIAERMDALQEKSVDIHKVVDFIHDVTEQTGLLALNARIEAARAGDAGRGFGVVAQHVEELARRTSSSTDEIKEDVSVIYEGISGLREFMLDQRTSLERVFEHVNKTDDAMDNIVASVEEVSEKIRNISAAAEEQSLTSEEISRAMGRISEITKNLNRSVLTIKEQAAGLSGNASNLREKTKWFKTNGATDHGVSEL
ncbi:MAG: methyl-accepting chemotaxis protein [Syntrophorhabdaceae bacterium]|nr:methyl-accepting chemotaxis protein [Syntrophorhabdaceae bacterium]